MSELGASLCRAIESCLARCELPEWRETIEREGFYRHWRIRGDSSASGLSLTYSYDTESVQLALLERSGDAPVNTLTATFGLEFDRATLNVTSESEPLLNFDRVVTDVKSPAVAEVLEAVERWILAR